MRKIKQIKKKPKTKVRKKKKFVPQFLRNIKNTEVFQEGFPADNRPNWMKKKYFRFQIHYRRKKDSIFCSGRFRELDLAQDRLDRFLKGEFEASFGNVNWRGK